MARCPKLKLFYVFYLLYIFLIIPASFAEAADDKKDDLINSENSSRMRIISLYPGHTDNVIALGGADMLAAVSENDDKDTLPDVPRLSMRTGAEAVIALRPDIVLARTLVGSVNPNLISVLERAGIRVEMIDPPMWDDFPEYLRNLASMLGINAEEAVLRLYNIKRKIADGVPAGAKRPRVFVEAVPRELHTCAPDSWAARFLELAGGVNAAADAVPLREGSALAACGAERLLKTAEGGLDVYLIQRGTMNASSADDLRARPWAAALEGVRIAEIAEAWLSRPSLIGLERGGEALLKILYGEGLSR